MMPISNQIFEAYREREKKIKEAIKFLRDNDYVVYKEGEYASTKK